MRQCRITVIRMACYEDLMEQYENPMEHPCNMKEGQIFIANGWEKPEGMCDSAWETMSPFVMTLAYGGSDIYSGWMKNKKSAMISCNDGFRPVSFLIEALDDPEEQRQRNKVKYRTVAREELTVELFASFSRRQEVSRCWRKEKGQWAIRETPFVDDWSRKEYEDLVRRLIHTADTGGLVYGAFVGGKLKGFAAVESEFFGRENQYLDLTLLHVSQDMRRQGMGKVLFAAAKLWAKGKGARKLYISAHSAVETQEFYKAVGCVEAEEYHIFHAEQEPCDCQLECAVE